MVTDEDSRRLWVWENEGGACRGPDPDLARRNPRPRQDTADGRDAMAAADGARAVAQVAGWGRTVSSTVRLCGRVGLGGSSQPTGRKNEVTR
jgi:hypothetical protein